MNIAGIQYSLKDRTYEIYISGCKGDNGVHCKGCHNPQTWDPQYGTPWKEAIKDLESNLELAGCSLVNAFWILGGEPLDSPEEELKELLAWIKERSSAKLWLFTRRTFNELPSWVKSEFNYIKCGPYDETQKGNHTEYGVTLSSLNQKIYKMEE